MNRCDLSTDSACFLRDRLGYCVIRLLSLKIFSYQLIARGKRSEWLSGAWIRMKELFSNNETWGALIFFWSTMMVFLFLKERHVVQDRIAFAIFTLYWVGTLIFAESLQAKLFVTLLMLSVVVIRFLVSRKRKSFTQTPKA